MAIFALSQRGTTESGPSFGIAGNTYCEMEATKKKRENFKMTDWSMTIDKVNNGYAVCNKGDDDELMMTVFEIPEDRDDDPETTQRLLYHILDYFDAGGNRYSKARVRVIIEPGDKCEDECARGESDPSDTGGLMPQ